jgi:hypothetical protein
MAATPAGRISFLKVKNPQEIKYDTLCIFQLNTLGTTVNEIPMDPLTSARTDMRERDIVQKKGHPHFMFCANGRSAKHEA